MSCGFVHLFGNNGIGNVAAAGSHLVIVDVLGVHQGHECKLKLRRMQIVERCLVCL